jgi:pyridoxal biosynthesis lyase PdxS
MVAEVEFVDESEVATPTDEAKQGEPIDAPT